MRIVILLATLALAASCRPGDPAHPTPPLIDCLSANQGPIQSALHAFEAAVQADGGLDWGMIEHEAVAAGVLAGGCALAYVVQSYLTPSPGRRAPSVPDGNLARYTLERYRAQHAGGASFRTSQGNL